MNKIITNSEKETFEFAKKYAKKLKGGEIIGLIGDLGTGKTIFTKGLAAGLGIKQTITSPTFVLMKVYPIQNSKFLPRRQAGKIQNFIHIDAYRIKTEQDILSIGADEYFNRDNTIVLIEWADKIKKILPNSIKYINIKIQEGDKRLIIK